MFPVLDLVFVEIDNLAQLVANADSHMNQHINLVLCRVQL